MSSALLVLNLDGYGPLSAYPYDSCRTDTGKIQNKKSDLHVQLYGYGTITNMVNFTVSVRENQVRSHVQSYRCGKNHVRSHVQLYGYGNLMGPDILVVWIRLYSLQTPACLRLCNTIVQYKNLMAQETKTSINAPKACQMAVLKLNTKNNIATNSPSPVIKSHHRSLKFICHISAQLPNICGSL